MFKDFFLNNVVFQNGDMKGTVNVISSNPQLVDWYVRFPMVPLEALYDHV